MAFENVFGNVDFQAPARSAQAQAAQFQQALGQGIANAQNQQRLDLQRRQLEQRASEFDLEGAAQRSFLKYQLTGQASPQDMANIQAYNAFRNPVFDPVTQSMQTPPPVTLGGRIGDTGYGQGSNQAYQGVPYDEIQPVLMNESDIQAQLQNTPIADQNVQTQTETIDPREYFKAPEAMGRAGMVAETEFAKSAGLEKIKSDLSFRKEQMKSEKGREKVAGTIQKAMDDLETLNDKLKAKQAIISNDATMLQNLKSKYGASWVGKQTASVTKPEIETLRQQYEVKRDSIIPSYIAYFDLPATVVDTEEFQKRILQSFGDPSLMYETNKAALENMRVQFGLEPSKDTEDVNSLLNKYAPR